MNWLLFYSEECSPKFRVFKTQAEAEAWAGQFLLERQHNREDNWVETLIKGCLVKEYLMWAKREQS